MKTLAVVAALAAALAACSGGGSSAAPRLPDVRLPTLGGPLGGSLSSCPTDKCLTVLVAPWCPVCHSVTPEIKEFRRYLDAKGVSSRVVVGQSDDLGAIKEFAASFGADALLDDRGAVPARGVPSFIVTDRAGRVLDAVDGFPQSSGPADLARDLGLL